MRHRYELRQTPKLAGLVSRCFGGALQCTVLCKGCGAQSRSTETMELFTIALDLPNVRLLRVFFFSFVVVVVVVVVVVSLIGDMRKQGRFTTTAATSSSTVAAGGGGRAATLGQLLARHFLPEALEGWLLSLLLCLLLFQQCSTTTVHACELAVLRRAHIGHLKPCMTEISRITVCAHARLYPHAPVPRHSRLSVACPYLVVVPRGARSTNLSL